MQRICKAVVKSYISVATYLAVLQWLWRNT